MFEDHPCFATLPSFDVNPPALTNAMALKAVQDDGSKLLDNDLAWLEGWEMDACEFEPTAGATNRPTCTALPFGSELT